MLRLFPKLTLAFVAVALTAVLIVGWTVGGAAQKEFDNYLRRGSTAQRLAAAAISLSEYHRANGGWEGVDDLVASIASQADSRLVVADAEGIIVADSGRALIGRRVGRPVLALAKPIRDGQEVVGYVYLQSQRDGSELGPLAAVGRLMRRGMGGHGTAPGPAAQAPASGQALFEGTDGELYDDQSVGPAEASFLRSLTDSLWLAAILATAVAAGLSLFLARQVTSPLRRLTRAAQQIARGNLSQRVEVSSQDEIGDLAAAFNAMADQLERNESARRHMVADVAHELNTPLSVIRGNLEAMLDGVVRPDPDQISSLYDESLLLTRLISDLRDLSLAEAGQLKLQLGPEDIGSLIRRAVERLQPQAQAKGINLITESDDNLPPVEADGDRVLQVIGNLLGNALRYTPTGGTITVAARLVGGSKSHDASPAVEVRVADNGVGIPGESLPHVFDRFYRTDPSRSRATGGSGLGLAIAQQLVQAHGGCIWVESQEGRGSTFYFTLPLASGAYPAAKLA